MDTTGTFKALFIMAEFPDEYITTATCAPDPWAPNQTDIPSWALNILENTTTPNVDSSMTSYFKVMSNNQHLLTGVEYPHVVHLQHGIAWYVSTYGQDGPTAPADHANLDVIDAVDSDPDPNYSFANFDRHPEPNGDGIVDFIFIYYREVRTGLAPAPRLTADAGIASLGGGTLVRDNVTIDLASGARVNPASEGRGFWTTLAVAAHEYGHHLQDLAYPLVGSHLTAIGKYGLMQGNAGNDEQGIVVMETYLRYRLQWIQPSVVLVPGQNLADGVPTTVTLTDVGKNGGAGFAIVRTQDPDQAFMLEMRDSTGTVFSRGGDCLQSKASSGLLVTHIATKSSTSSGAVFYHGGWRNQGSTAFVCTTPQCVSDPEVPCPNAKFPPLVDVESATGMFNLTTWAPSPVEGWDTLSYDETDPGRSSGADLYRPGPGSVSIFSAYTNPSTNLYWYPTHGENYYDISNCEVREQQYIRSGLTFYNVAWVTPPGNNGSGQVSVKVLYQSALTGTPKIADGTRWDGTVQLMGDVEVPDGSRLDIAPGARVVAAAHQDAFGGSAESEILVKGRAVAEGSAGGRIQLTSSRDPSFTHFLGAGEQGQSPTSTDWTGFRMNLDGCENPGYGYCGSIEPLSSIKSADIKNARNAIAIENFVAPSLSDVTFSNIDGNRHIYLKGSDVFIPRGYWTSTPCTNAHFQWTAGQWTLGPGTNVVATNTVSNDASWIGADGKVSFVADGKVTAVGTAQSPVVFRPETPDVANGDGWGGARLDAPSAGSMLYNCDFGYAAYPLVLFYPDSATTLRRSTVHHFGDTGLWIYGTGPLGAVVDTCLIQRGAGMDPSAGKRGARLDATTELRFQWDRVDLTGLNLLAGGSSDAIDVYFGKTLCSYNTNTGLDSLVIRNVEVIGPNAASPDDHQGISNLWVCGSSSVPRRILFENDYVHGFSTAGLGFHQSSDIQVTCNTVFDNIRAVDLHRDSDASGPGIRFRKNWLEVNVGDQEMVRTDHNQKTRLGRVDGVYDANVAENALAVHGAQPTVLWIEENDQSPNVVPAETNYWFLFQGGGWSQQLAEQPDHEPWASRIAPSYTSVDYDPWLQLGHPTYCHAGQTPWPLPPAGAQAARREVEFREPLREAGARSSAAVSGTTLPRANSLRAVGVPRASGSVTVELAVTAGQEGAYTVEVFDLRGRRVARVFSGLRTAGVQRVAWDGRDVEERSVASGIYFVRATGPSWAATCKIMVLR